jgi:hypothetical protein
MYQHAFETEKLFAFILGGEFWIDQYPEEFKEIMPY